MSDYLIIRMLVKVFNVKITKTAEKNYAKKKE